MLFRSPVVEAMMAGLPVITPKMTSLAEVGGEYAFYVDSPDPSLLAGKITHILELPKQQRDKHVSNARQWSMGFTWEKTATQTVQVLQFIVEKDQ